MNLLKKTALVASVLLATQLVHSQEAIPVSAGAAAGAGGSVSYTVGQVFYTSHTASTGSVSQGVQHPFEFQTLSNPELTTVNLTAVTYPNPTSDYVMLKISDSALDNLGYTLFDVTGKGISNGIITNKDTQIAMQQLAIGIYILKVNRHNQELKTFKIIKK
jgi:hypothetical protein